MAEADGAKNIGHVLSPVAEVAGVAVVADAVVFANTQETAISATTATRRLTTKQVKLIAIVGTQIIPFRRRDTRR